MRKPRSHARILLHRTWAITKTPPGISFLFLLFNKVFFLRGNVYFKQYLLSAGWPDIGWIMGAQNGINRQLSNGLTDSRQRANYFRVNRQGKEWLLVDKRIPDSRALLPKYSIFAGHI